MAIYIPSGGISTKDATAIPSDVAEGKIFYNADGRQVGNFQKPPFKVKSIVLPSGSDGENKITLWYSRMEYEKEYGADKWEAKASYSDYSGSGLTYYYSLEGINAILGIKINGGDFRILPSFGADASMEESLSQNFYSATEYGYSGYNNDKGKRETFRMAYVPTRKTLYLSSCPEDYQIEVFYV